MIHIFSAPPVKIMALFFCPQFTNQNNNPSHSEIKDFMYTRTTNSKTQLQENKCWSQKEGLKTHFLGILFFNILKNYSFNKEVEK